MLEEFIGTGGWGLYKSIHKILFAPFVVISQVFRARGPQHVQNNRVLSVLSTRNHQISFHKHKHWTENDKVLDWFENVPRSGGSGSGGLGK